MKLLLVLLLLIAGCKDPSVRVSPCISSGIPEYGCDGVDADEHPMHKKYEETKNWVMFSPEDTRALLEYCKLSKEPQP